MADTLPKSATTTDAAGDFVPATDELRYERRGATAILTFNRPEARNAMTFAMYQGLADACEHVDADERVRVLVLRGAGDKAFVAGTDISQFRSFKTADDVLNYEHTIVRNLSRLEQVRKPTIAAIRGFCVGGGALISAACDMRIAGRDVRFGMPVARTLGNVISSWGFSRLVALVGPARTKELLFTARMMEAEEGKAIGVFNEVVDPEQVEERALALAAQLAGHAPLTMQAAKEAVRRIVAQSEAVDLDDLILMCYLSADFKEGVEAFLAKRPPQWTGR